MLNDTLKIAAAGMKAQGDRLRIIAENVANADSTSTQPGGEPYRRKVVIFENALNKELGVETVRVAKRTYDMSDFRKKYDPTHPAADEQGYVLFPNVSSIIEMVDMRESRRAYEANINVVEVSKAMLTRTLELLR
jgi:flagellar basal-body rod protein FlgC